MIDPVNPGMEPACGPLDPGDPHYAAIAAYYGRRTAARSGVLLLRHIDEGLAILAAIGATRRAMAAFCIHPLLQDDAALAAALLPDTAFCKHALAPDAVVLAMEYRRVANAYLARHCEGEGDRIEVSVLPEVNAMLVADKVQNRKDFEIHHARTHPNRATLALYFQNWLRRLGVSESRYVELAAVCGLAKPECGS